MCCCVFKDPESLYLSGCCYDLIPLIIYAVFLLPLCCMGLVNLLLIAYQFTLKLELSNCSYNPQRVHQRRVLVHRMYANRRCLFISTGIFWIISLIILILRGILGGVRGGQIVGFLINILVFVIFAIHCFYMAWIPSFGEALTEMQKLQPIPFNPGPYGPYNQAFNNPYDSNSVYSGNFQQFQGAGQMVGGNLNQQQQQIQMQQQQQMQMQQQQQMQMYQQHMNDPNFQRANIQNLQFDAEGTEDLDRFPPIENKQIGAKGREQYI